MKDFGVAVTTIAEKLKGGSVFKTAGEFGSP
jgi:hypothetical protein